VVDPSKVDLSRIPQEARLKILEYVREEKGVKPRDLGVTSNLIYKIRKGEGKVSYRARYYKGKLGVIQYVAVFEVE